MRNRSAAAATAGAAAGVLLLAAPASAGTWVAGYHMSEKTGRTMQDVTGQHHGKIGTDVVLAGNSYKFPKASASYRPQHVVTVADAPALDPGTGTWSVTTRFRYTQASGNIVQKGQSTGPFFKMESHRGGLTCLFRGTSGSKAVGTGSRDLNDGLWHTVTCKRSGSVVSMTVDGVTRSATGATGRIDNTYPLSIGGKTACNGTTVGCDYWIGEMDYLRVEVG